MCRPSRTAVYCGSGVAAAVMRGEQPGATVRLGDEDRVPVRRRRCRRSAPCRGLDAAFTFAGEGWSDAGDANGECHVLSPLDTAPAPGGGSVATGDRVPTKR